MSKFDLNKWGRRSQVAAGCVMLVTSSVEHDPALGAIMLLLGAVMVAFAAVV